MKLEDLRRLLLMAVDVARGASGLLLSDPDYYRQTRIDLQRDIKIEADFATENHIISKLSQETEYPILSEESEEIEDVVNMTGCHWIVDPLDGSFNFSRGIPLCCISIALWDGMEPLLGVVHDFNRNELFFGIVGEGAWLNNAPIEVSKTREISQAVLCTGFPVNLDFSTDNLFEIIHSVREFKKVRLLGSAALSLAYVACGRADCYQEKDIKIWDVAGGIAIVKAAGGKIENNRSPKMNSFNVKAANIFLSL